MVSFNNSNSSSNTTNADVVELVDTPDLGSGALRCGGSSPLVRTTLLNYAFVAELVDALDSGSSVSNDVEVQVFSSAPSSHSF